MYQKLLRGACLAAATFIIGATASPTMGKTLTYYFTSQSGGGYCDGITISDEGSPSVWSGNFIGCSNGPPVGGFTTMIRGRRFIDIATTESAEPGWSFTFLLDTKALQWCLYSNYPEGIAFLELNTGGLTKHPPNNARGGQAKSAIFRNPRVMSRSASGCGL